MSEHNELNDEHDEKPSRSKKHEEERPQPMIADLLADPSFDPSGKVRVKLAEHVQREGVVALAPADLVDADGKPVE